MTEKRKWKRTRKDKFERRVKAAEKRDRMLVKDLSSERAVLEEVFDRSTRMTVYDFLNKGTIDEIHGAVKAGKESKIYWGLGSDGTELAIKIYLTVSSEFKKGMLPYIKGDPRFAHVKRGTRSLVYVWAQKEFKNLKRAYEAGVTAPEPIAVSKNVLVMRFVGENGTPAPLLKEASLDKPERTYRQLVTCIKKLYQKAELVHADLSEYNIMIWKGKPVLFDVSQAVSLKHPMAQQFLRRDLENLNRYFKKLGVKVQPMDELYKTVTGGTS